MSQLMKVIFKPEELQKLLDLKPAKIVIRTVVQEGTLHSGKKVGYVDVVAEATTEEGRVIDTVGGCPNPPCT